MRKRLSTLAFFFALITPVFSTTIYINDASFSPGDWCTAAGNDATGTGSSSAPYATLSKALSVVGVGDLIRADVGLYINQSALTVSLLSITIEGYSITSTVFQLTSGTSNFLTVTGNSFTLQNLTIKDYNSNTALQGKALTLTDVIDAVIYNVLFDGCLSASGGEPPVYISTSANNTDVLVRKCSFMNNIGNYGGAIDICSNTLSGAVLNKVNIDSSYFENNGKFLNNGGAIKIYNGSGSGGSTKAPIVNMYGNTFGNACTGNQAMRGGAIYVDNGASLTIDNSCFSNNQAIDVAGPDGGGAIWIGAAQITINDSKFENNTANTGTPKYGGGLFVDAGLGGTNLKLNRCAFINNTANRGAGIYAGKANLTMNNDLFYNNAASGAGSYGGGLAVNNSSANISMYNSTFSKNSTTGASRGDAIDGNSGNFNSFEIKNSILYANGTNKELDGGTSINVNWSIVGVSSTAGTDYTSVTGNSTLDPLFTNPGINDFTLSGTASPAYNTGNSDGGGAPTNDINSITRPQFDMGCYTLNSFPVLKWTCPNSVNLATITSTTTTICPGQSATLSVIPGNGYSYVWTSSPAGFSATTATVTVSPTVTTIYSVQINNITPSCGSYGTATFTVAIGPGPAVDIKPDRAGLCSGTSFNITGAGAATYTWSVSAGTLNPNTGSVVSYTAPTVSVSTTATISCIATSTAGCVNSVAATETIVISPNPTVTPSAFDSSLCSGATTTLTASGASTYTWSSSFGSLSSVNGDTITFTAPTVTAVTTVTVTLDGTSDSSCVNSVPGILILTINPNPVAPTISPGNSSICSGSTFTLTGGGVSTYTWNTTVGSFNSPNANPVIYTAPNVTVATTVTITTDGTSSAGCLSSSPAAIVLTITPFPMATLSASTDTMCAGGNATLTSNGASTYTWTSSPGTLNTNNGNVVFYTAPSTTIATTATITVVGTNSVGCVGTVPDTTFIYIRPTPVMTASATDSSLCSAQTSTMTATGANTYTWTTTPGSVSSNTINPTVYTAPTVTTITNATVTVNGTSLEGCQSLSPGILTLTLNPIPVIAINTASANLCSGSVTAFTANGAGTYTWTSSAGTLSPSTGNIVSYSAPNYTTATTETITVNGTSSAGCGAASPTSIVVTINPLPQVTAAATDTNFCGGTTTNLNASGANTYTWTSSSGILSSANGTPVTYTAPTLTTASTITVTLAGTSAAGCLSSNTDTVILYIDAVPQINVSAADSSICSNGSTILSSSGANSYTWSVSSGTVNSNFGTAIIYTAGSVSVASTITVSVSGTNTLGCNSIPTIFTLTVNPLPVINAVSNTTVICSGTTTTLTASGANSYSWTSTLGSFNSSSANPVIYTAPTTTTNVTVTISVDGVSTDGCNNATSATLTLAINAEPNPKITASTFSVCSGDSVILNATGANTYTWSASSGNINPVTGTPVYYSPNTSSIVSTSTVSVIGTSALGCTNAIPVTATFTTNPVTPPTITLNGSPGICPGNSLVLTSNPGSGITWSTGMTTSSITVTTSGSYSVTAINSFGCQGISPVITTTLFPVPSTPVIINSGSNLFCQGDSVQLSIAQPSGVTWQPGGQTTNSIYVNATGTYTVNYIDANGCPSPSASTSILVNPNPILNYTAAVVSPSHCNQQDGSINGISVSSGSGPFTYTWYDTTHTVIQTGNINLNPIGAGTYSLVVTDFHSCVANGISEVVPNLPGIQVILSGTPLSGNTPLTVSYNAQLSSSNTNGGYTWNYGEGGLTTTTINQPQHTYYTAGIYNTIVMVTDSFGCTSSDTIQIRVDELVSIVVPNIFTPNGDELNDGFSITTSGIKNIAITIFNRWGEHIIELEGNSIFWDGETKKGHKVPDGTYYYIVNYTTDDGEAKSLNGFVTVVR